LVVELDLFAEHFPTATRRFRMTDRAFQAREITPERIVHRVHESHIGRRRRALRSLDLSPAPPQQT
jgi:hypothetical protein